MSGAHSQLLNTHRPEHKKLSSVMWMNSAILEQFFELDLVIVISLNKQPDIYDSFLNSLKG